MENSEFILTNDRLKALNIQRNTVAKLTLTIRRQQQQFLYDEMKEMTDEQKLEFLQSHLISLQEKAYELRERELATAKVKEFVLQEILKLNKIDEKKYRVTGEVTQSSLQKRETDRFSKQARQFKRLNMADDVIINILKGQGCHNADEILKGI